MAVIRLIGHFNTEMSALICISWALMLLLAVHHGLKAQRGLRSGVVEGLVLGYSGNAYSRASNPAAFWVNVGAEFFVASIGVLTLLWALLVVLMIFSEGPL